MDAAIGAALLVVTFTLWLTTRAIGAGDVKLIAITGVIVGAKDALFFAALLLFFSVIYVALVAILRKLQWMPIVFSNRLVEIVQANRVPYGVPIGLAAVTIVVKTMIP
jgi:Flp pilus assembly protein protease CpaA